jgi:hypothetical protein
MPRKLFKALLPVAALGCIIVGSTIAWSNSPGLSGGMAPVTQPSVAQAAAPVISVDPTIIEATRLPARDSAPVKVDFNQAFADATALPYRHNTPTNREKLRDTGWIRIIGPR